jgi:hypothetical protein
MALLMAACASHGARPKPGPAARPELVTVPQLRTMVEQGETIGAILGRIDGSGTVYRLTTDQRAGLREAGMPAAILSKMEITYQHAITVNPALAKSDDRWIKRGDYWYGGLPAGWPREWVVGAPAPGEVFR